MNEWSMIPRRQWSTRILRIVRNAQNVSHDRLTITPVFLTGLHRYFLGGNAFRSDEAWLWWSSFRQCLYDEEKTAWVHCDDDSRRYPEVSRDFRRGKINRKQKEKHSRDFRKIKKMKEDGRSRDTVDTMHVSG